jgi:formylglycine-generating enzyme required for sulfatase activity
MRRRTLAGRFFPAEMIPLANVRASHAIVHPLQGGIPPAWAAEWGQDKKYGPSCSIRIADVIQRLRWIPPGRFLMGSPNDEKGRFASEGPQHQEIIATGFWIFDSPCTQAMWDAVMGKGTNPSHFKGLQRPVENVSWNDCQEFVTKLNERLGGLELGLPSESQREYACRGGTETARYGEDLDAIAWYAKNSTGETHDVKGKEPNGWGLYDMLGNVWEWCADAWRDDYSKPRVDKSDGGASARRVIRGGSWVSGAQSVRAAYRNLYEPSLRSYYLGFRCAEFRSGE